MISLTQDAQFMTNIVAANPIPAGQDFYVVNDENDEPAVFACSQDHKFEAVIMVNGVATLIDYGSLLGITTNVQAVNAQQGPDGTVFIAVAVDVGNSQSKLMILPSVPKASLATPPISSVISLSNISQIYSIYLSPGAMGVGSSSSLAPRVFLGFQPKDMITRTDQLGWIKFNASSSGSLSMTVDTTWQLPADPISIYDIAFIDANTLGAGVAVLFQSSAGTMLQFSSFEGDFNAQLQCPSNAQSLTSFYDPVAKTSSLVVGGDALTLFTFDDYTTAGATGTILSGGSQNPIAVKNMHCVQARTHLCIWYTTDADAVYYYTTSTSRISSGSLVQLLPAGSSGRISGLLSLRSTSNTRVDSLISVDEKGDLTLVQKSDDTGIWSRRSFFVASATDNMDIPSFTFRISATTDDPSNTTVGSCKLRIRSSGLVSTLLNGANASIAPAGDWYQADAHGCITLIVSTDDISTHSITIDGFQPQNGAQQSLKSITLDPSNDLKSALNQKFQGKTGADLLNMQTQTGNKLVRDSTVTTDEAKSAVSAFQQMTPITPSSDIPSQALSTTTASEHPSTTMSLGGFKETAWELFHLFEHLAEKAVSFVVQEYNKVKYLVITWAKETYNFVLKTVQQITKAINWVFNKIKVFIHDLIEFIGFLFEWDDVLHTADSIETFFNAALGYARQEIDVAGAAAEKWIRGLTGQVTTASKPTNTPAGSNYQHPNGTANSTYHGAHYNWSSYQVTHGGASTQSQITPVSGGNSPDPTQDLENMYNAITSEVKTFETFIQSLMNDIKQLFTPDTDTDAVFQRITTDVVTMLQQSLLNLVKFFTAGADLIADLLLQTLNAPIHVPIFSSLWKLITKGRPFTVLNCISLVLAVPTCILFKAVAKTAPPKLGGRLTITTFGQVVTGTGDASLAADIALIMGATAPAIVLLTGVVTVISQALDDGPVPMALESSALLSSEVSALGASSKLGKDDLLDLMSLVFGGLSLFGGWPLFGSNARDLRWSSWGLNVGNNLIAGVAWAIRRAKGTPRREIQRWLGPIFAVIATPVFALDEAVNASSLKVSGIDEILTITNIVQGVFIVVAAWANGVTCFTDGVDDPVSQTAFAVGEVVFWFARAFHGIAKVGYFWEMYADWAKKQNGGK